MTSPRQIRCAANKFDGMFALFHRGMKISLSFYNNASPDDAASFSGLTSGTGENLLHPGEVASGLENNRRTADTSACLIHSDAGRLAQLVRAPRLHRGGRGFESLSAH